MVARSFQPPILSVCNAILADEFPELAAKVEVILPDEKTCRVG